MKRCLYLLILLGFWLSPQYVLSWGNRYGHPQITGAAIEDLPLRMATVFRPVKQWLMDTSSDKGVRTQWDINEFSFHYINTDSDPNCQWPFTCLPQSYAGYVTTYKITNQTNPYYSHSNGLNGYVIDSLTLVLSTAYRNWCENPTWSNFTTTLYWMTRIAHYTEDLHQPFHLTKDSSPNGIHGRYESKLLEKFKPEISTKIGSATYQANRLKFVFSIISTVYPYYHSIANADTIAQNADPSRGDTYYTLLWSSTQNYTSTF